MVSHADSAVNVDGAFNLRDLADTARQAGYAVRRGMIYRSGFLTSVTDRGHEQFAALGLVTVLDLREPEEICAMPSNWRSATEVIALRELYPGEFDNSVLMTWGTDLDLATARARRLQTYRQMPKEFAPVVGHIFRMLGLGESYPMLIHCMGGKDRTGFIASLILGCLGVDRDTICREYTANAEQTSAVDPRSLDKLAEIYRMRDTGAESRQAMMETLPEHLEAALSVIDSEYGGVERYLIKGAGVTAGELQALRSRMAD